jgi:hypothetical protein
MLKIPHNPGTNFVHCGGVPQSLHGGARVNMRTQVDMTFHHLTYI